MQEKDIKFAVIGELESDLFIVNYTGGIIPKYLVHHKDGDKFSYLEHAINSIPKGFKIIMGLNKEVRYALPTM